MQYFKIDLEEMCSNMFVITWLNQPMRIQKCITQGIHHMILPWKDLEGMCCNMWPSAKREDQALSASTRNGVRVARRISSSIHEPGESEFPVVSSWRLSAKREDWVQSASTRNGVRVARRISSSIHEPDESEFPVGSSWRLSAKREDWVQNVNTRNGARVAHGISSSI